MKKYRYYYNEPVNSIVELLERSKYKFGDCPAIRYKSKKEIFEKSYNELYTDSLYTARYLLEQNLKKGHIVILGPSSYEWIVAYFGVALAGMVVVPIDKELTVSEINDLLTHSETDLIFYDETYSDVIDDLSKQYCYNQKCVSLTEINSFCYDNIELPELDENKLFSILYTSGTTGKPKGVMLSQKNIARNTTQGLSVANFIPQKDVMLSVLPFTHAYGFTCTILAMIYKGVTTCISSGLKYIKNDLNDFNPTLMFVVPLMVEKLMEGVETEVKRKGKEGKFNFGLKLSSFAKKLNVDLSDKLFGEVKAAFGGKLRVLVCGGAPLNEDLIDKYGAMGITLFQGYGLTECSPMLSVNFDHYHKANSVGRVVEGDYVKVVDGEIWAKGVSISNGYYNNPEETAKSFEDGWFKTGDLGTIDEDGFIFLTGRKKNLIILPNGENVSAEEIEALINEIKGVAEVLAYGKDNKIVAEIYLNPDIECDEKSIKNEITKINKRLPSYKNIDQVVFRSEPFPKTTSKKIKRYTQGE